MITVLDIYWEPRRGSWFNIEILVCREISLKSSKEQQCYYYASIIRECRFKLVHTQTPKLILGPMDRFKRNFNGTSYRKLFFALFMFLYRVRTTGGQLSCFSQKCVRHSKRVDKHYKPYIPKERSTILAYNGSQRECQDDAQQHKLQYNTHSHP